MAVLIPKWVGHDIRNDHSFSPVSGSSARTGTGTNQATVNRLSVAFGKAGRCAVPQTLPIRTHQEDRNENVVGHLLPKSAQRVEHRRKSTAPGDHLQKPLFSRNKSLRALLLSHIHHRSDEFGSPRLSF